jgi:hypothetical protein
MFCFINTNHHLIRMTSPPKLSRISEGLQSFSGKLHVCVCSAVSKVHYAMFGTALRAIIDT